MSKPQATDVDFIRALAELLRANDLTEIEVNREYGDSDALTVRVARQPAAAAPPAPAPMPLPQATPAPQPAAGAAAPADPEADAGIVHSPMVGTAYLQAEPGTPPFVKVGDMVAEGQTLLIIEAMKTMNQIPSPRAGRVKRILIEDGAPIEFGAPLMSIE